MEEVEKYPVEADGVKAEVKIQIDDENVKRYNLITPKISKPTSVLLTTIRTDLITEVKVSASEILDPKVINSLKIMRN